MPTLRETTIPDEAPSPNERIITDDTADVIDRLVRDGLHLNPDVIFAFIHTRKLLMDFTLSVAQAKDANPAMAMQAKTLYDKIRGYDG